MNIRKREPFHSNKLGLTILTLVNFLCLGLWILDFQLSIPKKEITIKVPFLKEEGLSRKEQLMVDAVERLIQKSLYLEALKKCDHYFLGTDFSDGFYEKGHLFYQSLSSSFENQKNWVKAMECFQKSFIVKAIPQGKCDKKQLVREVFLLNQLGKKKDAFKLANQSLQVLKGSSKGPLIASFGQEKLYLEDFKKELGVYATNQLLEPGKDVLFAWVLQRVLLRRAILLGMEEDPLIQDEIEKYKTFLLVKHLMKVLLPEQSISPFSFEGDPFHLFRLMDVLLKKQEVDQFNLINWYQELGLIEEVNIYENHLS